MAHIASQMLISLQVDELRLKAANAAKLKDELDE
jgi:hypothetical protein